MNIKEQLINTLSQINKRLASNYLDKEEKATLLLAKSNTLMALQKYE